MKFYYLAPLYLFSLWDYYIPLLGGRVFDYIGIVLIFTYLVFKFVKIENFGALRFNRVHALVMMAIFPSVMVAYFQGEWLAATAFLVGSLFVYGFFSSASYSLDKLHNQIGWLIFIELLFFFFQYVAFTLFGSVVDYHSYFGALNSRIFNEETGYFRAAGLFQEPNSFCLMLFMLNILHIFSRNGKSDMLLFSSLVAMFLSESLWGFGAILILLMVRAGLFSLNGVWLPLLLSVTGLASFVLVVFMSSPSLFATIVNPITVARIFDIGNDPSFKARFVGDTDVVLDGHLLVGNGLSTEFFQSFLGANAISFYIYSFGILGLLLFLGWIMATTKKGRLEIAVIILFAMTSYPLFTYVFWWAWLSILIQSRKIRYESVFFQNDLRMGK